MGRNGMGKSGNRSKHSRIADGPRQSLHSKLDLDYERTTCEANAHTQPVKTTTEAYHVFNGKEYKVGVKPHYWNGESLKDEEF